jgi:hypothetical protein
MAEQHLFKWRHFQAEIILLCVRFLVFATQPQMQRMPQERANALTNQGMQ